MEAMVIIALILGIPICLINLIMWFLVPFWINEIRKSINKNNFFYYKNSNNNDDKLLIDILNELKKLNKNE